MAYVSFKGLDWTSHAGELALEHDRKPLFDLFSTGERRKIQQKKEFYEGFNRNRD